MASDDYFGLMGLPLSCNFFLEPALKKYEHYIAPVSQDTKEFVSEWNKVLVDIIKNPKYRPFLGKVGQKSMTRKQELRLKYITKKRKSDEKEQSI